MSFSTGLKRACPNARKGRRRDKVVVVHFGGGPDDRRGGGPAPGAGAVDGCVGMVVDYGGRLAGEAMSGRGFIKQQRSEDVAALFGDPYAFTLLTVIAQRAKRTGTLDVHGLELGEAMLGDHRNYGMSRQQYRATIKRLKKYQLATFRTTNKGTIAKLTDTRIYDINIEAGNHQSDHPANQQATIDQPSSNHQATTNKNNNNGKNPFGEEVQEQLEEGSGGMVDLGLLQSQVAIKTEVLHAALVKHFPNRSKRSKHTHRVIVDYMVVRALSGDPEALQHLTAAVEWIREAKAPGIMYPEAKWTVLCQERAGCPKKKTEAEREEAKAERGRPASVADVIEHIAPRAAGDSRNESMVYREGGRNEAKGGLIWSGH